MLASTGKAGDLRVVATEPQGDALLVQVEDARLGVYWRGVFALSGRLVMLSATNAQNLNPPQSRTLVLKTITSLRNANGANQSQRAVQTAAAAP